MNTFITMLVDNLFAIITNLITFIATTAYQKRKAHKAMPHMHKFIKDIQTIADKPFK